MRVYVASSWRNPQHLALVYALRDVGHEVYNFRDPHGDGTDAGFHWSEIDPRWKQWTPGQFRDRLEHPIAVGGYEKDRNAMDWAQAFVLVMPCGRSAHLELGWACGAGKPTLILLSDGEPELMYRMPDRLCLSIDEVLHALGTAMEWA